MYPMLSQDILGYCSVYLRILRDMLVRGQDQMLSSVAFKVGRAVLCISAEGPAGIMYNTYYIILNIYYVFCIFHPCLYQPGGKPGIVPDATIDVALPRAVTARGEAHRRQLEELRRLFFDVKTIFAGGAYRSARARRGLRHCRAPRTRGAPRVPPARRAARRQPQRARHDAHPRPAELVHAGVRARLRQLRRVGECSAKGQ